MWQASHAFSTAMTIFEPSSLSPSRPQSWHLGCSCLWASSKVCVFFEAPCCRCCLWFYFLWHTKETHLHFLAFVVVVVCHGGVERSCKFLGFHKFYRFLFATISVVVLSIGYRNFHRRRRNLQILSAMVIGIVRSRARVHQRKPQLNLFTWYVIWGGGCKWPELENVDGPHLGCVVSATATPNQNL